MRTASPAFNLPFHPAAADSPPASAPPEHLSYQPRAPHSHPSATGQTAACQNRQRYPRQAHADRIFDRNSAPPQSSPTWFRVDDSRALATAIIGRYISGLPGPDEFVAILVITASSQAIIMTFCPPHSATGVVVLSCRRHIRRPRMIFVPAAADVAAKIDRGPKAMAGSDGVRIDHAFRRSPLALGH